MGSGLILLVIVGAWLAVLVPMALRSHDSATSSRSADRFSDAMRVLSRRGAGDAREVLVPRRATSSLVVSETRSARPVPAPHVADLPVEVHARHTAAERRLRTLLVLIGTALLSLGAAMLGVVAALWVNVACDLLLVAFVVHLRRQAVLRGQRVSRPAARSAASGRRVVRIAGIPDRMPARPAPLAAPLPAPAARYEDQMPAAATGTGGAWSPVPVPLPAYVSKAVAPRRQPRVLDLTRPGQWTAALEGDDAGLDILDEGPELEEILDRRRAVNGW